MHGNRTRTRDAADFDEHLLSTRASRARRLHSEMRTFGFGSGPRGPWFESTRPDHFFRVFPLITPTITIESVFVTS